MNGYIDKLKHKIALRIEPDKKQKHVPCMQIYLALDEKSVPSVHIFFAADAYNLFKAFYLEHTDYYRLPESDVYSATVEQEDGNYWFTLWGKTSMPYKGGLTHRLRELKQLLTDNHLLADPHITQVNAMIHDFARAESKNYANAPQDAGFV